MDLEPLFLEISQNYISKFPEIKDALLLKQEHCINVSKESVLIAKSLDLEKKDIKLAENIGLFHDIGRFPQFAEYKTFNDQISKDHGKLSVKEAIFKKITAKLPNSQKKTFISALFFHNKKYLPTWALKADNNKNEKKALFLKIIRDADKIDILRVMTSRYENMGNGQNFIEMGLPDKNFVSQKIVEELQNKKTASIENVKTLTDLKLLQISWLFDLNFSFSADLIKKRKLIKKIYSSINIKNKTEFLKNILKDFL